MKKLLAVLLTAVLVLSCATALAAEEPVRVAWWGSESSNKVYLTFSDMFTEATGIEYEAEYLAWGDYWTKINTLAAANDMPDMVRMDYAYIKNYVDKGLLLDLTSLVAEGKIDLSNVADSAITNTAGEDNSPADTMNCIGSTYRILAILVDECISSSWTAVPYHSDAIMYTGTWNLWPSPLQGRHNEIYTNTTRSYAELDFYGSGIRWYGAMNFDCGKADVMIDGVYQTTVDAYSPNRLPRQLLYSNTHLSPGHHIIKIFCNGEANNKATNCDVTIESFWYHSSAAPADVHSGFKSGIVKKAAQYISLNYSRDISIERMAEELHVSRSYLTSRFSAEMGLTPARYLANIRLSQSKELLSTTASPIAEVAAACGFQDSYYFSRFFKVNTGMTPSQYRKSSSDEEGGK